jgi:hypothetical protein
VREDRGNRWVLPVFFVLALLAGVLLFAAGGALRLWPVFVLRDRFSGLVAIQQGTRWLPAASTV